MKILAAFVFFSFSAFAGKAQNTDLRNTIARMDSVLFKAFNDCDTLKSMAMFTTDLEFFHDSDGLTGYKENNASIRYRCSQQYTVRRELVPGTLQVYPVKNFGAIQIGTHRFYYTPKNGTEVLDGTFRFVHVWKNDNGVWKIARVISYDH